MKYPLEFGKGRSLIKDKNNLDKVLKTMNGLTDCFLNIYSTKLYLDNGHPDYITSVIDRIFFDFDGDSAFDMAKKLHTYLINKQLKHSIYFSGGGYHIYVYTKNYQDLKYPKGALFNAQKQIIKDTARLSRIPNTYNLRRSRYCIPITELQHPDLIKQAALKQQYCNNKYGLEYFDMSKFDFQTDEVIVFDKTFVNHTVDLDVDFKNKLPPCILKIMSNPESNYVDRYSVIMYLKDALGLIYPETLQVMRKFLSTKKFLHSVKIEKQPYYLYRRNNLFFMCNKIKQLGHCPYQNKILCNKNDTFIYK